MRAVGRAGEQSDIETSAPIESATFRSAERQTGENVRICGDAIDRCRHLDGTVMLAWVPKMLRNAKLAGRLTVDRPALLSGSAAGHTATCYSGCSSGASAREPSWDRGARDRGPALERCLYDGPRLKPMRRAHVDLREPSLRRAIQECVLKSVGVAPDCWSTTRQ
jgi:hypothetical protein